MDFRICTICGDTVTPARNYGPHISAHKRSANKKYVYLNGDSKHPYELKICPTCGEESLIQKRRTYCSRRCSKMGNLNPSKQKASRHSLSRVEYVTAHQKVARIRGKASSCVNGCEDRDMYHWANLTGDYFDVYDYQEMCVPCHDAFDRAKGGE